MKKELNIKAAWNITKSHVELSKEDWLNLMNILKENHIQINNFWFEEDARKD